MNTLLSHINKQIDYNKGKNLFHPNGKNLFRFIPETSSVTRQISNLGREDENQLIEYLSNKAIEEFCRVNQYYYFDSLAKEKLKTIYSELLNTLKRGENPNNLSETHFGQLKKWLSETNRFSEKLYSNETFQLQCVVCSEYSPELQIELLNIDLSSIIEPVLDIGCGKNGTLVLYLRELGIDAYGIDRLTRNSTFLKQSDWLSYTFQPKHYGTMISNLGFSNHFKHHHLRTDGDFTGYARKYIEILNSLKNNGSFYYSPELPFIEKFLDPGNFIKVSNPINDTRFNATRIISVG